MNMTIPIQLPLTQEEAVELYSHFRFTIEGMANTIKILRQSIRKYRRYYKIRHIERFQAKCDEMKNGIVELLSALGKIYDEECTDYGTREVYEKWSRYIDTLKRKEVVEMGKCCGGKKG